MSFIYFKNLLYIPIYMRKITKRDGHKFDNLTITEVRIHHKYEFLFHSSRNILPGIELNTKEKII